MSDYVLEIVSHHPKFINKNLRKYHLDGIDTVGAKGNEPFEIRFKNNTGNKVQVKISVDGTDILTGQLASTEASQNMWLVKGYRSLSLKAWPETTNGGSSFIFTNADNGVATHTHGDLSSRGIIAAAVYVEGHVEPIKIDYILYCWGFGSNTIGGGSKGAYYNSTMPSKSSSKVRRRESATPISESYDDEVSLGLDSRRGLVAVGAGQQVEQKITYVTGLTKPVLDKIVKVRYLWWDQLVSKLKELKSVSPHASGFPGDREHKIMSIGSTPKLKHPTHNKTSNSQSFSRF